MEGFTLVIPDFPLWVAQILRALCILFGPVGVILCIRLAWWPNIRKHRRFIYAGIALLLASSTYTEIDKWDSTTTPRLFINTLGTAFILWGLRTMRNYKMEDV